MKCAGLAILVPNSKARRVAARTAADTKFVNAQAAIIGDELARRVAQTQAPLVSNRIKHQVSGPIACKLIAVPLMSSKNKLLGALVIFSRPDAPSFDDKAVQRAERIAKVVVDSYRNDKDALTRLLTWDAFKRKATRWAKELGSKEPYCIAYGDIDRLHVVNDLSGFAAGDRVIADVGTAVRRRVREVGGYAARLSGDRFTLLLPKHTLEAARKLCDGIAAAVGQLATESRERPHQVTLSWGIALATGGQAGLEHGIAEAEIACKAAKERGRARVEIYQSNDASIVRRYDDVAEIARLHEALTNERVELFAQPIAPLINQQLDVTYELLARLRTAQGDLIEPSTFMSAATRYQVLPQLDRAVVRRAFTQLKDFFKKSGGETPRVSINLSVPTICGDDFADWMLALMAEFEINGSRLVFEITEAAAAANIERLQQSMKRLTATGARFALDDFGTGVNSLAYLKSLDVGTIKLDGSYVRDVEKNSRSEAMVTAIVQLANGMGITTVAEYVETPSLRARLAQLGVQFGQGFAIGRPAPLQDVLDAVAARGSEQFSLSA
jgi:diguanylate cyclase (GGDEF)-like protein